MEKLISALLCLILLATVCASCSVPTTDDAQTETAALTDAGEETGGRTNYQDALPTDLNFEGKDVTVSVLQSDYYKADWIAESETGDLVNDAVYRRNLSVEERLNVKIKTLCIYSSDETGAAANVNSILAGENAFDIMNVTAYCFPLVAANKVLIDIKSVPYLDVEQPWWNKSSLEVSSFYGKAYVITGEIAFRYISGIAVMIFNKELEAAYNLDIYKDYFDGKWTFEKLGSYTQAAYSDLNGNGNRDKEDQFGYASDIIACVDAFYMPLDIPITEMREGIPVLTLNNEKTVNAMTMLYDFFYINEGTRILTDGVQTPEHYTLFNSGQVLINGAQLGNLYTTLRETGFDFGIVSYPKYDEKQEHYYSHNRNGYSMYAFPVTCADIELAGAVLEASAAENYRSVMPAYFETALKVKYTRDNEAAQVLDTILAGVRCDFAFFTDIMNLIRSLLAEKVTDFASYYAKKENGYQNQIDKLLMSFE